MPDNDLPPAYDGVLTSNRYDGYDGVLTSTSTGTSTSQPEGFEMAQDDEVDSDFEL